MRGPGLLLESEDGRSRILLRAGEPPILVGRNPPFGPESVRLPSILVSRQHVRLFAHGDDYRVEDAGSSGGAYVDDTRVAGPTAIGPGARLKLASDTIFVARRFLGGSLWELRGGAVDGPPLSVPETLTVARDVLGALRPLHGAGEVHGEITPHHLVLDELGPVWTLLVHGWTVLDPDGTASCHPMYLAPETITLDRLVLASDLYALALVLFEALTARRPFPPDEPDEHMAAKQRGGAPDWGERCPFSPPLRAWFDRLLSLEPHDRGDLAGALGGLAGLR